MERKVFIRYTHSSVGMSSKLLCHVGIALPVERRGQQAGVVLLLPSLGQVVLYHCILHRGSVRIGQPAWQETQTEV